ncbi:MAG: S41 family peptidase, partial [Chitinophagaceae bacterium]
MVYNSFLGDSAETVNEFQRVFSRFSAENVDDVIIDLRYNGGGYVFYQRVLANYLINNAGNGNTMMKTEYNDKYSQYNSTTKFSKTGTLNLSRIFFIVSKYSASASELLINNLKPYMDVVLVGPDKTYGKPVGYFNIGVGDWYIFPVSSRTTNKNGEGNYFNGFALNNTAADGIDKDWGHTDESSLASTLKYISTGAFRIRSKSYQEDPVVIRANNKFDEPAFKGMIDARRF